MPDFEQARRRMVETQLARRGISDARVLDAMGTVPRERFVAAGMADLAYEDGPLPIGEGQTISQPFIVAWMIEAAQIGPRARVLDVGTGSGYAAAVASLVAARVFTIERHAALAESARATFVELGYGNIVTRVGDGTQGWPEEAPFDAILAAAAARSVPPALKDQLAVGGRLVMPLGRWSRQRLVRFTRTGADSFEEDDLGAVAFVPLVGS